MAENPDISGAAADAPPAGRFIRWLHGAYFRGEGIRHFLARRTRPAGAAVTIAMGCLAPLVAAYSRGPIYQSFSICFVLFTTGIIWSFARRARLTARRELPRHATVGVPVSYPVRVRNHGRFRIKRAWLMETPPDPRPDLAGFQRFREPGEDERNRFDRKFAYFRWQWLISKRRLFFASSAAGELRSDGGRESSIRMEITPLRRGVISLTDLRVRLPDPFGLFQKCVPVEAAPGTIVVLPRRYPLPPVRLPGSAAFNLSGETTSNTIGPSGEFVGLREYRSGDPVRLIHWKSWARTGRPIVKELEDTFYPRYGLVLDTCSNEGADPCFEDAVSVAASFAVGIDTSESLLDLMFVKNEAHRVTAGRGLERAEKLLEVLAGVTPEAVHDYHALSSLVLRHRDDLTSCVVIFNGWDDARRAFLDILVRAGVVCVPILIGRGLKPPGAPGHWLECGHIARDLKHLPQTL
jgi:uncharacterized protein (DUF58 family)